MDEPSENTIIHREMASNFRKKNMNKIDFMIPTNFFISSSQVAYCMTFHVRYVVIIAPVSITEFMHVMVVLDSSNVQYAVIDNMFANRNPMDFVWSIRHTAINVVHVVLKDASK